MATTQTPPTGEAVVGPRISHAVQLTSAQLARGLFRLLFILVVARELGPQQLGVYALLLAVVEMVATVSGSGYADFLTRESARDARIGWGLASQLTLLRFACAFLFTLIGIGMLAVLGYSRTILVATVWLSLSLVPRSIGESVQGVLRGIGRYGLYLTVELVFDLVLAAGATYLIFARGGLREVIATEIFAPTAASAVSISLALLLRPSGRIWIGARQLLEKSVIFNTYAFVSNLYDRFDIVLLSRLAGDYATGVYSAAYRPLGTIQLVPYGVLYSLLPSLSRGTPIERERMEKAMGILLSISFAIVLVTVVFAGPAIHLLFGVRYADSAVALKILIWAVILRYVNYAFNVRLLADGHERVFVVTSLICLGVNLVGNLIFIPLYSWRAAGAITIATEAVLLAQNIFWLRRLVGTIPKPVGWMRSSFVFAVLAVVVFAGARTAAPSLIGSACVLVFLGYLYYAGIIKEFAAVWDDGRR